MAHRDPAAREQECDSPPTRPTGSNRFWCSRPLLADQLARIGLAAEARSTKVASSDEEEGAPATASAENQFSLLVEERTKKNPHARRELRPAGTPPPRGQGEDNFAAKLEKAPPRNGQLFDFFLVLDFEATCEEYATTFPHEIIEFPIVVVDAARRTVVGEFHSYVRPRLQSGRLTKFCTQLTGITQEQVDRAPELQAVIASFDAWFARHVPAGAKCVFATDGPWDMRDFMFRHSVCRDGIEFPRLFFSYVDVRHSFADHMRCKPRGVQAMLAKLGLTFEGREHSGLHDARNIARVLISMMNRGHRFERVSRVNEELIRRQLHAAEAAERLEGSSTRPPPKPSDAPRKAIPGSSPARLPPQRPAAHKRAPRAS